MRTVTGASNFGRHFEILSALLRGADIFFNRTRDENY